MREKSNKKIDILSMSNSIIIFESPKRWHKWLIKCYLFLGYKVYVVEPFHTYHYKKNVARFYPDATPAYVNNLLETGRISQVKATNLNTRDLYVLSAEKAVANVENIYPGFSKQSTNVINCLCGILKSNVTENIFRKNLCDRLAVFYSINIVLNRISKMFPDSSIKMYPNIDLTLYLSLKVLIEQQHGELYYHENIRFSKVCFIKDLLKRYYHSFLMVTVLFGQVVFSILSRLFRKTGYIHETKKYRYGVTIIGLERQFANTQRGPDFLVDGVKIRAEEIIYFPLVPLNKKHFEKAKERRINILLIPNKRRFFSNSQQWFRLLYAVSKDNWLRNPEIIREAISSAGEYFRWLKVMEEVTIQHFITSCDFGIAHIARNIALKQHNVETWYFTDSMNFGCNYTNNGKIKYRHPNWSYLNYDRFVTWNSFLADFFNSHPTMFQKHHVVGCLWSEHVTGKNGERLSSKDKFKLSVYDSTYTRNGITSYEEGIAFAEHINKLTKELPDIFVHFKVKKDKKIHEKLDSILGLRLLEIYAKMEMNPNIKIYENKEDSSVLMRDSDMIISFPFTSTTFEALSINKPAIWHDPLGYYRNTPYDRIGNVTTHNYEELKSKIVEIRNMPEGVFQAPFPMDSPLMDPYRDGKAIDRFRDLLIGASK